MEIIQIIVKFLTWKKMKKHNECLIEKYTQKKDV